MREEISGGAIIQHISKLRQRLEATSKDVPPPPRRGGGPGNSNSRGRNISLSTPVNLKSAAPRRTRTSANAGSNIKTSESEEEQVDVDRASDSQEEFGSRRAGKNAAKIEKREPKVEIANDGGPQQGDQETAGNASKKRKRERGSDRPLKRNRGPAVKKFYTDKNRKGNHPAPSSVSSGEDASSWDESPKIGNGANQQDVLGQQFFAVGADFFKDYDQDDASTPRASSCGESSVANRVLVLKLGEGEPAKALLRGLQSQERLARATDADSVACSGTTSIARFDGGREKMVHGDEASSNIADVDYYSATLGNSSHLSREYAQRLPQVSLSHESGTFAVNNKYSSIGDGDDSVLGGNNATYNSSVFSNHNLQPSGDWNFRSIPTELVPMDFAAPVGYPAHLNQQENLGVFGPSNIYSDSYNIPSNHASSLGQGSGWSAPPAFDRGSAITPTPDYVPPTALSRNNAGTGPAVYGNSFCGSQASSGVYAQQVQNSAVISSTSSAETPVSGFPALSSFLPDSASATQVAGIENSDDVNWTDFLADFHGGEDISDTNLMTTISGQHDGGTEAEE